MALFEASNLKVKYIRNGEFLCPFDDVSFSLEAGRIYDLEGQSGSGKSTLLLTCARMIARESGDLRLSGKDSLQFSPQQWRRNVCLVPQQAVMFNGTVRDNLLFPWTLSVNAGEMPPSDDLLSDMLNRALLDGITLDTEAAKLSGGQQARIALIRAFATRPHVLLLDEAESSLDSESALAVSELTRSVLDKNTTCIRIRHRASDGYAYATYTLKNGELKYRVNESTELNKPVE